MRRWLESVAMRKPGRPGPVTDPLRVMIIDPEAYSVVALGRAIDLDRDMAVVGQCRDFRRTSHEASRCAPDLVAVRLGMDDDRCRQILTALAASAGKPCVVVLGPAGAPEDAAADASRLVVRIRAVAEAALSRDGDIASPVVVPADAPRMLRHLN